MVGIVRPENFNIFIRKVGYSVGLEKTLERLTDFANIYAGSPQLKHGDWLNLVHNIWNLKTTNIEDVFSALGIAKIANQGVYASPIGEAAGICSRVLQNVEQRKKAFQYLLALAITLADGDIFLNGLLVGFQPEKISEQLRKMILTKRQFLFEFFHTQVAREAIAGAISIERQKNNSGGAKKSVSKLGKLGLGTAKDKLGLPKPKDVLSVEFPSDEYIRHVIPSRREWARTLGFIDGDSQLTDLGIAWLESILSTRILLPVTQEVCLLPTKSELMQSGFSSIEGLVSKSPDTWDYVRDVFCALGGQYQPGVSEKESRILAEKTREIFSHYRELSQDRRMLRNELSFLVAVASYAAISFAQNTRMFDYSSWLTNVNLDQYRIKLRTSRRTELGIIVS